MKNLFKAVFFCLLVAGVLTGCKVTEEISFEENFSGSYSVKIDASQIMALMEGYDDSLKQDGLEGMNMKESIGHLNDLPGISNARDISDKSKYIYGLSYDFESVEALNNAKNTELKNAATHSEGEADDEDKKEVVFYEMKGKKKFIVRSEVPDLSKDETGMAEILQQTNFKQIYHFKKPVKKVDNDNYEVENQDVILDTDLGTYVGEDFEREVVIKF